MAKLACLARSQLGAAFDLSECGCILAPLCNIGGFLAVRCYLAIVLLSRLRQGSTSCIRCKATEVVAKTGKVRLAAAVAGCCAVGSKRRLGAVRWPTAHT